jgi:hypothetical protein
MKRALVALLALLLLAVAGCQSSDVGIPCKMQTSSGDTTQGAQINAQGLDCETRLCLYVGGVKEAIPQCTKICGEDGDCPGSSDLCADGFRCVALLQTGALKCCKMCVCKKFLSTTADVGSSTVCANYTANCPSL